MSNLESWLRSRRKIQSIVMIRDHSRSVVSATEQLERCLNYALEGNYEALERSFSTLEQKEKAADLLKKKIITELTKGELPPSDREDLMRLTRRIDHVIDWVNETGRILVEFKLDTAPDNLLQMFPKIITVIKSCVHSVDICIDNLFEKRFQDALKAADDVERLEEEMDYLNMQARKEIGGFTQDTVKIGEAILISQLMESLENTTDRCEDVVDLVRALSVAASINF